MAVVKGIKEKVHLPIYDCIHVEPEKQLRDVETSSTLKFFIDVQGKTKLQTNLQSAGLLPHYNTFEARAMRVVISDLAPEFSTEAAGSGENVPVMVDDPAGNPRNLFINGAGTTLSRDGGTGTGADLAAANPAGTPPDVRVAADIEMTLDRLVDLLKEAREAEGETSIDADDEDVTLRRLNGANLGATEIALVRARAGVTIPLSVSDIQDMIDELDDDKRIPPKAQLAPDNGAGTLLGNFIYNTVTTFFVGEKVMIQMPTWFFPSGAGPYSQSGKGLTHGEPNPTATFRFAEPIFIEKQQNFRVEIEVPDADSLKEIQRIYGPFNIWVVLDGYMTRNVQ